MNKTLEALWDENVKAAARAMNTNKEVDILREQLRSAEESNRVAVQLAQDARGRLQRLIQQGAEPVGEEITDGHD